MDRQDRNRIVINTSSGRNRQGRASSGVRPAMTRGRPREGLVAISVIAAAAFATFIALFLTSRPYDPMNSTFDAQSQVPQAPIAMPASPRTSPTPTPAQTQNAATPEPAGRVDETAPPDDASIQAQIEKAMNTDSALAGLDVSTFVESGKVTIVGSVRNADLKQRVERAVRTVKGVLTVDNQLVLLEPTPGGIDLSREAQYEGYRLFSEPVSFTPGF